MVVSLYMKSLLRILLTVSVFLPRCDTPESRRNDRYNMRIQLFKQLEPEEIIINTFVRQQN